jgi:hypothetical protein
LPLAARLPKRAQKGANRAPTEIGYQLGMRIIGRLPGIRGASVKIFSSFLAQGLAFTNRRISERPPNGVAK